MCMVETWPSPKAVPGARWGQITAVGDSAVALLLGLTAGILCYFIDFSDTYLSWMAFSKEFFFYGAY